MKNLFAAARLEHGRLPLAFIPTGVAPRDGVPPVVLLHSFDSSCLEMRRVLPLLAAAGVEAYALEILGWGFTSTCEVASVGVEAKREHLLAFWEQHLQTRPALLVGSSLGAAAVIDFAVAHARAVHSVALLDPQAFIDGAPPVPAFAASAGLRLLRSWPLRSLGQKLAYENRRCDTDDAIRVGRFHCRREGWEDNGIAWLMGGGYSVSTLVGRLVPQLSSLDALPHPVGP